MKKTDSVKNLSFLPQEVIEKIMYDDIFNTDNKKYPVCLYQPKTVLKRIKTWKLVSKYYRSRLNHMICVILKGEKCGYMYQHGVYLVKALTNISKFADFLALDAANCAVGIISPTTNLTLKESVNIVTSDLSNGVSYFRWFLNMLGRGNPTSYILFKLNDDGSVIAEWRKYSLDIFLFNGYIHELCTQIVEFKVNDLKCSALDIRCEIKGDYITGVEHSLREFNSLPKILKTALRKDIFNDSQGYYPMG